MSNDLIPNNNNKGKIATLNQGEIDCLRFVHAGLVSKEIARQLDISPHTVDARLKSACGKLGTKSRFQAASILAECCPDASDATASSPDTKLAYEDWVLPGRASLDDKEASAGEGGGPGDFRPKPGSRPEAHASGDGRSWLESGHPLAKFLGVENRLPTGRRLLLIAAIAIATGILFTALVNSYVVLSQMLSPPI